MVTGILPVMMRCLQCNATLRARGRYLYGCGSAVPQAHPKTTYGQHFQSIVKVLFILSAVLTVASIFTDYVPGFAKCFGSMVILFFVKNSADQMTETGKSRRSNPSCRSSSRRSPAQVRSRQILRIHRRAKCNPCVERMKNGLRDRGNLRRLLHIEETRPVRSPLSSLIK